MKNIFVLICLLSVIQCYAGIGVVSDTKGNNDCVILRAKDKLPGTKGTSVESMDTYKTGGCSGSLSFIDDTKVKVSENSKLLIDDFVFDTSKSDAGKLALKVTMGTVRYASGQIAKTNPQHVAINTPTATIAVRGTDFTMTVDEIGQSLIMLLPSCKDEKDVKKYELEENRCKVGSIEVKTLIGGVLLDEAFQATYVFTANLPPTPPIKINIVEGKIDNSLIISKPQEIQRIIKDTQKSRNNSEIDIAEAEAQQATKRHEQPNIEQARIIVMQDTAIRTGCNPSTNVCVSWERNDAADIQSRGKGIAFRVNPDHYAEIKTQGYDSNTQVNITHDDNPASYTIGSGDPGGSIINIKQNTGVVKPK